MNKRICVLLTIVIMCSLTGCGSINWNTRIDSAPEYADRIRFVKTGNEYIIDDLMWTEYVDTETDNLYLCNAFSDGVNRAGLSPLYDKNGDIAKYHE